MTRILLTSAAIALFAVLPLRAGDASNEQHHHHHGQAASMAKAGLQGLYMEARTADVYIGQCFRNSEVGLVGDLGVMGWKVEKGALGGVSLDGLSVVAVVRANGTIGDIHTDFLPSKAVLIVDAKADAMQQVALQQLARQLAGPLVGEVVAVNVESINLDFANGDVHSRVGTLKAGALVDLQTRAIRATDKVCSHEDTVYPPMANGVDHAMPAFTVEHRFTGKGLNTTWSSPFKMSAFVGTFQLGEDGNLLVSRNE
ncbi:MAG: DUF1326 domain-containing protein [Bryobacterales bacterium]|jgi:hypothetical protein|nr:DUF1326 domain-containing protein [Bryobacterales bacterium]